MNTESMAMSIDPNNPNRLVASCGCWRATVSRQVIDFYEQAEGDHVAGEPKRDADGNFLMRTNEDVEEGYCEEHSREVGRRQEAVAKALAEGANPLEAMRLLGIPVLDEEAELLEAHVDIKALPEEESAS
jgi:hypothetical protein